VLGGRGAQVVEDDPGLDAGGAGGRVDRVDSVAPGQVQHEPAAGGVAGEAGAAAARHDRDAELPRRGHGGHRVVRALRDHHGEWHLPVVGSVHCVQSAGPGVEADLPGDGDGQPPSETRGVHRHVHCGSSCAVACGSTVVAQAECLTVS
jgi:hypothetical protein